MEWLNRYRNPYLKQSGELLNDVDRDKILELLESTLYGLRLADNGPPVELI
jgi:hypothetical protein